MRRTFAALLLLITTAGCSAKHGSVRDGMYVAPGKLFQVAAPALHEGGVTRDVFTGEGFMVAFSDDSGRLFRIDAAPAGAVGFRDGMSRERALATAFSRVSVPSLQSASPSVIYSRQSWEPELRGGALLYKAILPDGATIADARSGVRRRADSTRAILVFFEEGRFVQVTAQASALVDRHPDELWREAKDGVLLFASGLRFAAR